MTDTSETTTTAARPKGRSQSPAVTARILGVAREMLLAKGVAGVTVDEVARQAKVGLGTLYRRWDSKEALLADVIAGTVAEDVIIPDSGDLATDLTSMFRQVVVSWGELSRLMVIGLGEIRNEVLADRARSLHRDRRAHSGVVVERAIERGEVPRGTDPALLHDLIFGILWPRLVVLDDPLAEWEIAAIVQTVVSGAQAGLMRRRGAGK